MKKIFITLLLVVSSMTIQAQEKLTWHTNIDEAIAVSKTENKPLFLFFTGSDWCGWCIRLQNEVFKTPEFIAWAKEKVVLVELDFPRRTPQSDALKIQNSQLQQFFAIRGYPSVRIAKAGAPVDGKTSFELLGETGYLAGGPTVWLDGANKMVAKFVPYKAEEQKAAKKAIVKKKEENAKQQIKVEANNSKKTNREKELEERIKELENEKNSLTNYFKVGQKVCTDGKEKSIMGTDYCTIVGTIVSVSESSYRVKINYYSGECLKSAILMNNGDNNYTVHINEIYEFSSKTLWKGCN